MERGPEIPPRAVNEDRVPRGHAVDAEEGKGDRAAEGRRPGTARDPSHLAPGRDDAVPVRRRHGPVDLEAEEISVHVASVCGAGDDLLPDVAAFREADRALGCDLEGEGELPHVRSDPGDARLDPERLECGSPDGGRPGPEKAVPDRLPGAGRRPPGGRGPPPGPG